MIIIPIELHITINGHATIIGGFADQQQKVCSTRIGSANLVISKLEGMLGTNFNSVEHFVIMEDKALIDLYRHTKDIKVVAVIFKRHQHRILGTAINILKNKMDAEDLTMDIFEHLCQTLGHYDIENFKSWVCIVTRNKALRYLKKKMKSSDFNESINNGVDVADELADKMELENRIEHLESAISQLKGIQRKCIELFYWEKKSYSEIQDLTGQSFKEVKSHLQNGKRMLSQIMI